MIRTETLEEMDQEEFQARIVDKFGDAGIISLSDYDLSEVIVSFDETILWVPDFRTIDPFGPSTGVFTPVETVTTHRFQLNGVNENEDDNTQRIYQLSTEMDKQINQLIAKNRVETLAEIVDMHPDELVSKAKISPQSNYYPILLEFPERLGKIFVAPVKNEQETMPAPIKSGGLKSEESGLDRQMNEVDISVPNIS